MANPIPFLMACVFLQGPLAAAASVRILPVGDSITHGYWSGISTDYNSYRKELKNLLESNGHPVDFVGSLSDGNFSDNQHEGHDGWYADHATKTNTILGHVSGWISATSAEMILLHIGTNDLLDDGGSAAEVSDILDEIFSANRNATVVLALILNVQTGSPVLSGDISTYNSNLNAMAQARMANGDDIIVVDMENGAGIDYASADMNDRLHPSQTGYDKMAALWYPAVVQAIANQAPKPYIESVVVSDGTIILELGHLLPGRQTFIEQANSLSPPVWSNAAAFIPSTPSTPWTLPSGAAQAYYRIRIP